MDVSILVNKGSASTSEVFTRAMKDYGKAKYMALKHLVKALFKQHTNLMTALY